MDPIPSSDNLDEKYLVYLNDESGIVTDGRAERIFFPTTVEQLQKVVQDSFAQEIPITVSGGGTGISGGRVPRSGWILATDKIHSLIGEFQGGKTWKWTEPTTKEQFQIHLEEKSQITAELTVPISMTIHAIQELTRELGWFYPPDPTERSCYIGGNVATNASGARSFKYGATREWIQKIWVILPEGELITLDRSTSNHQITGTEIIIRGNREYQIPRPNYTIPKTRKHVAGPVITDSSHPLDLFVGTEGLFGIIAQVTIRLIRPPNHLVSIFVYFDSLESCLELIKVCQKLRSENSQKTPLSVEYVGPRAISIMREADTSINEKAHSLVILELEGSSEDQLYSHLEYWLKLFEDLNSLDTSVAQDHSEIEHHKYLRHKVPETINSYVRSYGQSKLGTDYSVPISHTSSLFHLAFRLGGNFENFLLKSNKRRGDYGYVIWAHGGDAHIHLNFLPRNDTEKNMAKQLMIEMMKEVVDWGGSIAAEHGLGKKEFEDKPAIVLQFGEKIEDIKTMKEIIDPKNLLNRGNVLGRD